MKKQEVVVRPVQPAVEQKQKTGQAVTTRRPQPARVNFSVMYGGKATGGF